MSDSYSSWQAAKLLNVTPQCMWSLIKRNRIKAELKKKFYVVTREDLQGYISLRVSELNKEIDELQKTLKLIK